jgi:hypothetical protein
MTRRTFRARGQFVYLRLSFSLLALLVRRKFGVLGIIGGRGFSRLDHRVGGMVILPCSSTLPPCATTMDRSPVSIRARASASASVASPVEGF